MSKLPLALIASGILGGLLLLGGGKGGSKLAPKNDSVSEVFSTQEAEFRKAIGELVGKLRAGELTSEQQAKEWMEGRYVPEAEKAWQKLLMAEKAAFGEDRWTAEKHAAFIEEYTR